jgi:hypothetical protein
MDEKLGKLDRIYDLFISDLYFSIPYVKIYRVVAFRKNWLNVSLGVALVFCPVVCNFLIFRQRLYPDHKLQNKFISLLL